MHELGKSYSHFAHFKSHSKIKIMKIRKMMKIRNYVKNYRLIFLLKHL